MVGLDSRAVAMGLVAILVATVLAGCASPSPPAVTGGATSSAQSTDAAAGSAENATDNSTLEPPTARVLFLAPQKLVPASPATGETAFGGGYASCFVLRSCGILEFQSEPLATPISIATSVTVHLWVRADGPVLHSNVYDFGAWFGSTRGTPYSAVIQYGQPVLPGAPAHVGLTLDAATLRPVVIPAGEKFRLVVVSGMLHEGSGLLKLLYGGSGASQVAFTAQNLSRDPMLDVGTVTASHQAATIPLPSLAVPPALGGEGRTNASFSLTMGPNTSYLEIKERQTDGLQEPADVDLDLFEGGVVVSGSHTPGADEAILLVGPGGRGLAGKTLTLQVTNFWGFNTAVSIEILHD